MIKINLAGLNVLIDNRYPHLEAQCKEYLYDFEEADLNIAVSERDIEKERKNSGFAGSDGYYESMAVYRNICEQLPLFDRLMLHSAVVELDGRAVAYCGKSGAGKTTHAMLLCEAFDGLRILNGDKPIVHIESDGITVYGTPWQGEENLGLNASARLDAVCFLAQSESDRIETVPKSEVLSPLLGQFIVPRDPSAVARYLELVDRLINSVDLYRLYCTANHNAAVLSYNTLFTKEK